MDANRLVIFGHVARAGSMSGAARALGWSQPAVSQHVRHLERELATPLLTRGGRGSALTQAGEVLARHAEGVSARLAAAEREVAELVGLQAGTVRLCAFPSAAATLVPSALGHLARRHPGLEAGVTESEPAAAIEAVRGGSSDVAIVFAYAPGALPPDLESRWLVDEQVLAVLPERHALASRRQLSLDELSRERWVAGCPSCRGHLVDQALQAGFIPDIRHETDDYVVAQRLVAEGLGVALLPARSYAVARQPGVAVVPLDGVRFHVGTVVRPEAARVPEVAAMLAAFDAACADEARDTTRVTASQGRPR